jgi:hypothetical protein
MKKEKKWVVRRWNSLCTITSSLWVLEFNVYETMKWNFALRAGVSSKFYFVLYDMTALKTTQWNSPWHWPIKPAWAGANKSPLSWEESKSSDMDAHQTPVIIYIYSFRPKTSVIFTSRETTLTKYILKILIFMVYNWYHWKDLWI